MDKIIKANIQRFKKLLETEQDPVKRDMITRLLREEREKQNSRRPTPTNDAATPERADTVR